VQHHDLKKMPSHVNRSNFGFSGKVFVLLFCLGFLLRTRTITDRYNITTEWHTQRDLLANTDNTAEENSLIFFSELFFIF
jgi:hypothetical protein